MLLEGAEGAQVCEFRGVVFQGESKARSLARRVGKLGHTRGPEGQRWLDSQTERPGVERLSICGVVRDSEMVNDKSDPGALRTLGGYGNTVMR